jgi:hypothetical protein
LIRRKHDPRKLAGDAARVTSVKERAGGTCTLAEQFRMSLPPSLPMSYFVLLAAVLLFLSLVSMVDPSGRRMRVVRSQPAHRPASALQQNVELIAAEMHRRYGSRQGDDLLRVPAAALHGARKEEQPCLTPIECVQDKRCDGHCGCH